MSQLKEISNALMSSVLSSVGSFRLFGLEEETKEEKPVESEVEVYNPPEPITIDKLRNVNREFGVIYTCFPENRDEKFSHHPESYFTLSSKEKLLLLFAENFRRQFKEHYASRRPLVLAVENECQVQKFVSTTIRPTTLVEFSELIDNWRACASFLADHILYEPLENPTKIVSENV
ncbi:CLUMA_CG002657, isoform A [Clunio marinus]|uniref:CLUMA_CG002657, isoform A n=1 Tax=Clunio marinus TaxID=568069 RepID=A0A1J1HLK5_9DIPT|nr:CLUMA_CG002657, isoform A [Clunio marinus]